MTAAGACRQDALLRSGWAVEPGDGEVLVPALPRISNHTDLDPLRLHAGVDLCLVEPGEAIPAADLIVLPGSKSVGADLKTSAAG